MKNDRQNTFDDRPKQSLPRLLSALLLPLGLLLTSCTTPVAQAPRKIVVSEDLHFTWRPPIGFPERETTISAGTYEYESSDAAGFFFVAASGYVSCGKPGEKAEKFSGGVGVDRFSGELYVWQASTTVETLLPVGPVLVHGKGGRPAHPYIGKLPKDLLSKVQITR